MCHVPCIWQWVFRKSVYGYLCLQFVSWSYPVCSVNIPYQMLLSAESTSLTWPSKTHTDERRRFWRGVVFLTDNSQHWGGFLQAFSKDLILLAFAGQGTSLESSGLVLSLWVFHTHQSLFLINCQDRFFFPRLAGHLLLRMYELVNSVISRLFV